MDKLINFFFNLFASHRYLFEILLVFVVAAISHLIARVVYHRIYPKLKGNRHFWDHSLLFALIRPLKCAIWWHASVLSALIAGNHLSNQKILTHVPSISKIGSIILLVWFGLRFIRTAEKNYITSTGRRKDRLDKTSVHALSQICRLATSVLGGLVIVQSLGIPLSGVIAFGGVGGLAIGFASKDLLANFFGGLMIFLDRPFAIGDWIRSPDKNIEGTVEHIGWRLTRIRTFDKRPLYIPNGLFSTISIENASRMQNRRIKETIGLRYEDAPKMASILRQIEEMLKNHEEIDQTKTTFVNLVHFAPYSLEFLIYTFTKTTDWVTFQAIQQDIFLKVLNIIESNGAKCAFPTKTLEISEPLPLESAVQKLATKL